METKKSFVRAAEFKAKAAGQYGEYFIHLITFVNGDKGDYISKSKEQKTFEAGKEYEYTITETTNGKYKNVQIKPVTAAGAFVPGKTNPLHEHKRTALRCAVDLVVSNKIELKKLEAFAKSFMKFLNE